MNRGIQSKTATKLLQISEVSRDNPGYKFVSLANLLNEEYLAKCYRGLKKNKAPGIDKVSVEDYGERLEENLHKLVERMKSWSYRPQNIRRVFIREAQGGQRPLGIPTVEDKLVQKGVSENSRSLKNYCASVERMIFKWLNRRSQKNSFNWHSFKLYLQKHPLPKPKIHVSFYT
mgnify:CR=1 FL=1